MKPFFGIDWAYGPDHTVVFYSSVSACRCGHHPRAFSSSPSLSTMTTHDIMKLLENMGHKACEIRDDGNGRINIITESSLTRHQQEIIEASMPAGVIALFTIKTKIKAPVPKILEKWASNTFKEIKKP